VRPSGVTAKRDDRRTLTAALKRLFGSGVLTTAADLAAMACLRLRLLFRALASSARRSRRAANEAQLLLRRAAGNCD
jgi:hypothetical protein